MSAEQWQGISIALVAVMLLGVAVRWARTPDTHPDNQARGDMMRLVAVVLGAQIGSLVRDRFAPRSVGFWLCSLALLPLAVAALVLIRRLLSAYRRSGQALPARPVVPSRPPPSLSDMRTSDTRTGEQRANHERP